LKDFMAKKPHRPGAPLPGYDMLGDQSLAHAAPQQPLQEEYEPSPEELALPPGFPTGPRPGAQAQPQPHTMAPQPLPQAMQHPVPPQMQGGFPPQPAGFPPADAPQRQSRPLPTQARPAAPQQQNFGLPNFTQPVQPGFAPVAPTANPLMAFTRMPGMHIRLPSQGAYMEPGALALTSTGELPVYPMRAADEVLMKNPDALMSGQAVESLIASCVPGIRDPRMVSMPDLDVLLLAIRAASYGEKMEFEVKCPKCGEENVFDAHLPSLLATVSQLPATYPIPLQEGLTAYMRPYALKNATQVAIVSFEETRRIQSIEGQPDEVKAQTIAGSLKRITALSELMLNDCVVAVETPQGTVTDPNHIREFLADIPRDWTKRMEVGLKDLNSYGLSKKIKPTCSKCQHTWETELEFDPSSFFGQGS
jgi:hypothetical protein